MGDFPSHQSFSKEIAETIGLEEAIIFEQIKSSDVKKVSFKQLKKNSTFLSEKKIISALDKLEKLNLIEKSRDYYSLKIIKTRSISRSFLKKNHKSSFLREIIFQAKQLGVKKRTVKDNLEKIKKKISSNRKESLIRACKDGQDKDARWNMMMASTEGAMAFSKGLGAVHSMSHAVGADQELRLHHGTLNGVILPTILRFNKDHVGDKYARISRAMGKDESTDLAEEIEKLNEKIGLPSGLGAMGVSEDMIPNLVAHSMTDPSNMTTPRLPSQEEWEKLFLEAM